MKSANVPEPPRPPRPGRMQEALNGIEWAGNRLPDPAMLFVWALGLQAPYTYP